jgi:hypothetical protein
MKWTACLLVGVLGVVWPLVPAGAESSEGVVPGVHLAVSGHITKIESGLLFVKMPYGLQLRTISPNKADRVGLHDARVGDTVWLLVDSGNVLLDATRPGGEDFANHKCWPVVYSTPIPIGGKSRSRLRRGSNGLRWIRWQGASSRCSRKGCP